VAQTLKHRGFWSYSNPNLVYNFNPIGFDEQGGFQDDYLHALVAQTLQHPLHHRENLGMRDLIQLAQGLRGTEYDLAQLLAVDLAIFLEGFVAEGSDYLLPSLGMGFVYLVTELIGIDDDGTQLGKDLSYRALPSENPPRKTYDKHRPECVQPILSKVAMPVK
jgi:hypothetical protein